MPRREKNCSSLCVSKLDTLYVVSPELVTGFCYASVTIYLCSTWNNAIVWVWLIRKSSKCARGAQRKTATCYNCSGTVPDGIACAVRSKLKAVPTSRMEYAGDTSTSCMTSLKSMKKKQQTPSSMVPATSKAVPAPSDMDEASRILVKHELEVKRISGEIIEGTVAVGEKYFALASYVRDNKLGKKIVAQWLGEMGFNRHRISEINAVANSDEAHWSEFAAKAISWKGVLQLTRGNVEELRRVSPEIVSPEMQEAADEAHREQLEVEEKATQGMSPAEAEKAKKAAFKNAMNTAAVKILKYAALTKCKAKVWKDESGYVLTLSKKPVAKPIEVESQTA